MSRTEDTLSIATVDPFDVVILNEIRSRFDSRYKIKPYLAFSKDIESKLNEVFERMDMDALDSVFENLGEEEAEEMQSLSVIEEQEDEIDLENVAMEQVQQSF